MVNFKNMVITTIVASVLLVNLLSINDNISNRYSLNNTVHSTEISSLNKNIERTNNITNEIHNQLNQTSLSNPLESSFVLLTTSITSLKLLPQYMDTSISFISVVFSLLPLSISSTISNLVISILFVVVVFVMMKGFLKVNLDG